MNELQRSIDELLLLYKLEPKTKDIFVEGISDKLVLQRFVEKNNLPDVKIIEVHEIDFKALYKDFSDIKSNNRAKLIALNKTLEETFVEPLDGVSIIIDRDFDEILDSMLTGEYILYTDYNSLELYLYNSHTIDIFYNNILHTFPINGDETLKRLNPVLIDKFLVRLTLNKDSIVSSEKFTPFEKTVLIDKPGCSVSFVAYDHIKKVLNNTRKMAELPEYQSYFEDLKVNLPLEVKKAIRGHDFINLFFQFINKIKNHIGLTLETLERTLFQCIDFSKLKEEALFALIIEKYSMH